ncbi:MAG TPA: hypothetical protein VIL50_08535, partial [Candidatus Limnocylindrales bacterium]
MGGMTDDQDRPAVEALDPADASLLALVDRLGSLLDRSDLSELAVQAGGTRLVLRKPAAIATTILAAPVGEAAAAGAAGGVLDGVAPTAEAPSRPSIKAPLTGVWYGSPAPGSAPFV